ncbi:hypothetical protein QP268_11360, partial [Streptococcus agalactiae]|nr:hypothetical protein [Streptococcus agalactiae]
MPGCVIILPKTVSERLDLSFGIFARRGEKYSCYDLKNNFSDGLLFIQINALLPNSLPRPLLPPAAR